AHSLGQPVVVRPAESAGGCYRLDPCDLHRTSQGTDCGGEPSCVTTRRGGGPVWQGRRRRCGLGGREPTRTPPGGPAVRRGGVYRGAMALNLGPGEQIIFEGHPSWRAILDFYIKGIFAVAVIFALVLWLADSTTLAVAILVVGSALVVLTGFIRRV